MKTLTFFLTLCLFCINQNSYAQSKYGNATMDELNMTEYPQDTSAVAVVLLKKGDTRFVISELYGFQFEYTLQMKIKILKTEGLDWCDEEIGYYEDTNLSKEQINGLSGTTYNLENGKIVKTKLSKEYITEENQDKKYKVRKFSMPAAKVGSVIEYKYTIVSPFFYELREFSFQESIPVAYTYYECTIPEYFRYNTNFQGYVSLNTVREPANESFHLSGQVVRCSAEKIKSEGKNIPAIKKESFMWSINDYITKVSFELRSINMPFSTTKNYSSSWANIDNELLSSGYFGGNLKKSDLFKEEIKKGDITLDKAHEIQNMVKYRVKWNEKSSYAPSNLKETLKTGLGNNADINFLLINALQAGGFEAFPVILSTRANGRIPMFHASITALDYVITGVKIDTMVYYTDASAKYGDWNLLPEKCMVTQARVIQKDNCRWVNLSTLSNGSTMRLGKFSVVGDKYTGEITDTRKGCSAYDLKDYYYNRHKDQQDYIETLAKKSSCEIEDFSISNTDDNSKPVVVKYTQKSDINIGDDFLYITPLIDKQFSENPFKTETREYPINFDYPLAYVQSIDIAIPEGYVVDELPKPARMILNDNDIVLVYRVGQTGNNIKIHYQFQVKKLLFLPEEYESIRDFFAKAVSINSEQIVLKKASEEQQL